MTYGIVLSATARGHLRAIRDRRILRQLGKRIDGLAESPDSQGKPLGGELAGFRSVRAVGQTYRIIYRIEERIVTVVVMAVGRRKEKDISDVYELTKRLLKLGLIELPKKKARTK